VPYFVLVDGILHLSFWSESDYSRRACGALCAAGPDPNQFFFAIRPGRLLGAIISLRDRNLNGNICTKTPWTQPRLRIFFVERVLPFYSNSEITVASSPVQVQSQVVSPIVSGHFGNSNPPEVPRRRPLCIGGRAIKRRQRIVPGQKFALLFL